ITLFTPLTRKIKTLLLFLQIFYITNPFLLIKQFIFNLPNAESINFRINGGESNPIREFIRHVINTYGADVLIMRQDGMYQLNLEKYYIPNDLLEVQDRFVKSAMAANEDNDLRNEMLKE